MNFIQRRQHIWVPEVIACQNGILLQHGNNLGDIPLNFRGVMGYIAKHEFKKILIIFKIKKIATPSDAGTSFCVPRCSYPSLY
jgi:hypothetical protein